MPWVVALGGLAALFVLALTAPEPTFEGPAPITLTITVMPEDAGRLPPQSAGVLTVPAPPFGEVTLG